MKHLLLLAALTLTLVAAGCPQKGGKTKAKGVDPSANTAVSAGARAKIRQTMDQIKKACVTYNSKHGKWPADMEELVGSKIWPAQDREDPWGNDYVIEAEGSKVTVSTYGADGEPGGEGRDADYTTD